MSLQRGKPERVQVFRTIVRPLPVPPSIALQGPRQQPTPVPHIQSATSDTLLPPTQPKRERFHRSRPVHDRRRERLRRALRQPQDIAAKHNHLLRIRHRRLKPRDDLGKINRADGQLRNAERPFPLRDLLPTPMFDYGLGPIQFHPAPHAPQKILIGWLMRERCLVTRWSAAFRACVKNNRPKISTLPVGV